MRIGCPIAKGYFSSSPDGWEGTTRAPTLLPEPHFLEVVARIGKCKNRRFRILEFPIDESLFCNILTPNGFLLLSKSQFITTVVYALGRENAEDH
jgi:hypothetical protein